MLLDLYFVVYYIEFKLSVNICTYMLMNIVLKKVYMSSTKVSTVLKL